MYSIAKYCWMHFFESFYEHLVMYNFFSILGELVQYLSSYDLRKTHTINSPNLRKLTRQSIYTYSDPLVRYSTCVVAIIVWADVSIAADTVPCVTGRAISLWRARVAGMLFFVSLICVASCQLAQVSWVLQVQLLEFARTVKVQHPCSSSMETWRWGAALLERLEQRELAELFRKCLY